MQENEYRPVIGKDMLRNLIINLYDDSRTIFREYIQNACDAIYDATNMGILSKVEEGHVAITIDKKERTIKISDNGSGVPAENAVSTLMDISRSIRNGIDNAGQYGIGRLVGGGYCDKLEFTTSTFGEDIETTVSINTVLLREILDDDSDDRSAEDVMQQICSYSVRNVEANEHYFHVTMYNVKNASEILLDEELVMDYIRDYAPLDYTVQFKQLVANNLGEFEDLYKQIRCIPVSVNGKVNIRKRYGLSIEGNGDPIYALHFFKLTDAKYGDMGWGWYAITPFTKAIPDSDPSRLIRLRKHNISLDIDILSKYFKEPRGNKYFYGEIFATHPKLEPNSARNGLVAGEESIAFYDLVKDYFNTLYKVYYSAADVKKKLERVAAEYDKVNNNKGLDFYEDAKNQLRLTWKAFIESVGRPDVPNEVKEVYTIYYERFNDELKDKVDPILAEGNTKLEPQVQTDKTPVQPTDSVNISPDQSTKPVAPAGESHQPVVSSIPTADTTQPVAASIPEVPTIKTNNTSINLADICKKMEDVGYSQEVIQHTRKIFGCLTVYCPTPSRGQLNELIKKTVEMLLKR